MFGPLWRLLSLVAEQPQGYPAYEAVTGFFDHPEHEVQYQARAGPVEKFCSR
jgi:hypothetical protein